MKAAAISALRDAARRRMPKWIFDYMEGGSYSELTLRSNRVDLDAITFEQRVMVDVSVRQMRTTLAGQMARLPIAAAPTGLAGFIYADGEIHAARAAEAAGVPYCLSTVSICSIEEVAAATSTPFWFQLYIMRDRGVTLSLIERARDASCPVLVVTVDLPIQAQRHKDIRNGLAVPMRFSMSQIAEMMIKPRWSIGMLKAGRYDFGNLAAFVKASRGISGFAQWVAESFDSSLTWEDIGWIRKQWDGKLILKGILSVHDARLAKDMGADAIVISNHGGRQLDGACSSISALRSMAQEDNLPELLFDSGVRSGQDILKALACGARGVLIGRAHLYGLGAAGEAGVTRCLKILSSELEISMALIGQTDVTAIDPRILSSCIPKLKPALDDGDSTGLTNASRF